METNTTIELWAIIIIANIWASQGQVGLTLAYLLLAFLITFLNYRRTKK